MNNELITIHDNSVLIKAVNSKELYEKLNVKDNHRNWIKDQINHADLKENIDYIRGEEKTASGQIMKIYYLSIDAAKNIAMLNRSEVGKDIRAYFISCEKELKENNFRLPATFEEALEDLLATIKEKKKLEHTINTSTLFSEKEKAYDKERVYNKDIKKMYPYLNNSINNIMEFFGKYKYKDTSSYVREEVEICVGEFLETCTKEVSSKKRSVLIYHECLIGGKLCVKKDLAIKYLNYTEEDFILN